MEPPESTPSPDAFFAGLTSDEHAVIREAAMARAREQLPCENCGSTSRAGDSQAGTALGRMVGRPVRAFLGCAKCGAYLERLPVWLRYPAWFMSDRRAGLG